MRASIPIVAVVGLLLVQSAYGQGTQIYDGQYAGPRNAYGQPTYQPMYAPQATQPGYSQYAPQGYYGGQQPMYPGNYQQGYYGGQTQMGQYANQPNNGLLHRAFRGLYNVGTHAWQYMPAPVRGAQSPNQVPDGSGNVSVIYVPGQR